MNVLEQVKEALRDLADELEAEVQGRHGVHTEQGCHPAMEGRLKRDMEAVTDGRTALAALEACEVVEGNVCPANVNFGKRNQHIPIQMVAHEKDATFTHSAILLLELKP